MNRKYYCLMATERVYIITEEKEPPPQRVFSNLKKLIESFSKSEYDIPTYSALQSRLYRARKRTGKSIIRLKKKDGTFLMIELKDVE